MTGPNLVNVPNPTGAASSPTPPTGAPTSPPPPAEKWRAGEDFPEHFRGKTAEEILADYNRVNSQYQQAYSTLERFNQTRNLEPPGPVQPAMTASERFDVGDEDYVSGKQVKTLLAQAVQQAQAQFAPQLAAGAEIGASTAYAIVKERPQNRDIFQRYGGEVQTYLSGLPMEHRTLDNLQKIVDIVAGQHRQELTDELATIKARQLVSQMEPTMRSIGGAGSEPVSSPTHDGPQLDDASLPAEWRANMARVGATLATVDEFCKANQMTRARYFEMLTKPGLVSEVRLGRPMEVEIR